MFIIAKVTEAPHKVELMFMSAALVTFAIGERYQRLFSRYCLHSWKAYCERYGYDLVVIESPIQPIPGRSFAWQKLLLFDHPEVRKYDRIVFADSDIIISKNAPPILENLPVGKVGYVRAPENIGSEHLWYDHFRLPHYPSIVQTGVLCLEQCHQAILHRALDYPESEMYEMPALSCEIMKSGLGYRLDDRFNAVVGTLLASEMPVWMVVNKWIKEGAWQLGFPPMHRSVEGLCKNNWFLHAAGAKRDLDRIARTLARLQNKA